LIWWYAPTLKIEISKKIISFEDNKKDFAALIFPAAFNPNLAAVRFNQSFRNCQSNAAAAPLALERDGSTRNKRSKMWSRCLVSIPAPVSLADTSSSEKVLVKLITTFPRGDVN
jgi:hypothetical protein